MTGHHATVADGVVKGVSAGADTVIYQVMNQCGAKQASMSLTVNPQPVAGVISGKQSLCIGMITTLADSNSLGAGMWLSSDSTIATINSQSGIVTSLNSGTASISYQVANYCGSALATYIVIIDSTLHPAISGPNSVCADNALDTLIATPDDGTWTLTNEHAIVIPQGRFGIVKGVQEGYDTITYSIFNNCGTFSDSLIIQINKGGICDTSTIDTQHTFSFPEPTVLVYPNPNTGKFTVEIPRKGNSEIVVTDMLNRILLTTTVSTNVLNEKLDFDLEGATPGVYFIRVTEGKNIYRNKIMILHGN